MIGDLLLTWISETGKGKVSDLRARAAWLARTEDLDVHESATGRWLRDAASLGHCEVDWKQGTWAVAPPVIARLPLADGLAVLAGARRPRLLRAIDEQGIYTELVARPCSNRDIPAPRTVLIPFERASDLEDAASALSATYVGCAAAGIANLLKRVHPLNPSAPPAYESRLDNLTSVNPKVWTPVSARHLRPTDGLYREQINGRWQHLLYRDSSWYAVDLAPGIFEELARLKQTVIRWRPDTGSRIRPGTLIVDWGAPLPPLHSRALVLCSGFTPRFGDTAETALYDNVPFELAARVASSLGQTMQITN